MEEFATWLAGTRVSTLILDTAWAVPSLQTVHILAIAMVLSSSGMIVLRLFGRAGLRATLTETLDRYLPWIWGALVVLAATGALLVTGEPERSLLNPVFQLKMLLLVAAIAATVVLARQMRSAAVAHGAAARPAVVGLALAGFLLWCGIAVAGRWIAYVL
jgi:uncharacterized membrane protein SirB2